MREEKRAMPFYTYWQNNSGGVWDGPAQNVVIEAPSAEMANDRAEKLAGIYFNGVDDGIDCECCGDRWHPMWVGLDQGDEKLPAGSYSKTRVGSTSEGGFPRVAAYFSDGTIYYA
jgi:hypothetical protein